jgi:ArsR family transcriptional regulator
MATSTVFDPTIVEVSELFAALSDPVRVRIVDLLAGGGRCVCDLLRDVDVAPNLLSYHLRVLRRAGLIVGTRRGRWVDYRLAQEGLDRLHAALPSVSPEVVGTERCP